MKLEGIRVLDLSRFLPGPHLAMMMADHGADVIKVEDTKSGDPARIIGPVQAGHTVYFRNANRGKRSLAVDLKSEAGREAFMRLAETADVILETFRPGVVDRLGIGYEAVRARAPQIVYASISAFGQSGPYRDRPAHDLSVNALAGIASLSVDGDGKPAMACLPPSDMGGSLMALAGILMALLRREATGRGDYLDLSMFDTVVSWTAHVVGRVFADGLAPNPSSQRTQGGAAFYRPYRTKDGRYIQLAVFMTGHWRVLSRQWMEDGVLSGDDWDSSQYRTDNEDLAQVLIQSFVEQYDRDEFVEEAQKRGLACCPVNTFEDFVTDDHMRQRGWFQTVTHPVAGEYVTPGAPFIMSATPWAAPRPAPLLDQHRAEVLAEIDAVPPRRETDPSPTDSGRAPDAALLDGVRVADITRAFAGPIGTMFLGFYGAEVIKVESESLEANREPNRPLFPDMNRNKLSCTLDLRSDGGKDLFRRLIRESDLVVDNFSATVMRRLGLGYDDLAAINPGIIQIGMPGMGTQGPLNTWVTYGNNLQAVTGLSLLWGHPDSPMESHAKGVIPDYVGAAFVALSAAAALEHRDVTGRGQAIEIAQVDGQGAMMGPAILDYTLNRRIWGSVGYEEPMAAHCAPYGAYPCRYADTWIVIACETDAHWQALAQAMGAPQWAEDPRFADTEGRRANREEIDHEIREWTQAFTSHQLLYMLQTAGVPAGIAMNGEDLYHDPHLRERGHVVQASHSPWGLLSHQGLPAIPSLSQATAAKPAPWIGADNDYIYTSVLSMSEAEIAQGRENGVLR